LSIPRVIFWYIGMNLLDKAAHFEKLCRQLTKRAQVITDKPFRFNTPIPPASLSGPTPEYKVHQRPEDVTIPVSALPDVAPPPSPAQPKVYQPVLPTQTLTMFAKQLMNFELERYPGTSVDVEAVKKLGNDLSLAVQNKQSANILKVLTEALNLLRNGGGSLYGMAQDLFAAVKRSMPKAPPAKKPDNFLDRYMAEEKAKQVSDEQKNQMQASLDYSTIFEDALK
jgi:hypothetical protein